MQQAASVVYILAFSFLGCVGGRSTKSPPQTTVSHPSLPVNPSIAPRKETPAPGESFIAAAPRGFTTNDLGRPFTADFRRLQGDDGKSLLPHAGAPTQSHQGYMEHSFIAAESKRDISAHASAWGLAGGAQAREIQRYASYRAVQIRDVYEINDATPFRDIPTAAVYYPWRVYTGHSYEMLFEGSEEVFTTDVRAQMAVWSLGVKNFAAKYQLAHRSVGIGLKPRTPDAIFARTQEEIEKAYETMDEPVVILVEWREIPGRKGNVAEIKWHEPRIGCAGQPGCQACQEWAFDYVEWNSPRTNNGDSWDLDGSAPDVILSLIDHDGTTRISSEQEVYKFKWKLEPSFRVKSGKYVILMGVDKDLTGNGDDIDRLRTRIQDYHDVEGGTSRVTFGNGSAFMSGTCIRP
jgi:hypothetical protein